MADTLPAGLTAYTISLTDGELQTLGRITAIWAQIDHLTDHLLSRVLNLTPPEFGARFGKMGSGGKLAELDLAILALPEGPGRQFIHTFLVAASRVKEDRNHAVHGVWGHRMQGAKDKPAARHPRANGKPLHSYRLKQLELDLARASVLGAAALGHWEKLALMLPMNFYFGAPERPPARLREEPGSRIVGPAIPRQT